MLKRKGSRTRIVEARILMAKVTSIYYKKANNFLYIKGENCVDILR